MHNDGFRLFTGFWWLIFPLFWMVSGMVRTWSRHARANRTLDLIKSYADQGKEPPAALLQSLQAADQDDMLGRSRYRDRGPYGWIPVCLFLGLATAFGFMAWLPVEGVNDGGHVRGMIFVAIIMAALALGFLVTMLAGRRDDRNRTLPDDKAK